MQKKRSRDQWFLGLDTCKELISISLKEINTHWQLIKDLFLLFSLQRFLKWPCIIGNHRFLWRGWVLMPLESGYFS